MPPAARTESGSAHAGRTESGSAHAGAQETRTPGGDPLGSGVHGQGPQEAAPPSAQAGTHRAEDVAGERHSSEDPTPGEDNRNSIEQWMADLRSSRRRPEPEEPDEGKHRNSGRTVSVNELLRRQNRD